jgi:hypothetical protein
MRKYLFIISFSALLAINTAFAYECKPTYWNACSDGDCESGVGDMTIYFSEVEVARSGVMLKAASATNSYLLVINTVDLKFTEIATLLTTAYVKSGSCAQ